MLNISMQATSFVCDHLCWWEVVGSQLQTRGVVRQPEKKAE